jgi:hypothetical protein
MHLTNNCAAHVAAKRFFSLMLCRLMLRLHH